MLYCAGYERRACLRLELVEFFDNAIFLIEAFARYRMLELVEFFDNAIFLSKNYCSIIWLELVEFFDNAILFLIFRYPFK